MVELKTISKEAIPAALAKAERYRLLQEPAEAESICLDVLRIDPENREATVTLLLALTDQFEGGGAGFVRRAQELLPKLRDEYLERYYAGVVCERWAKAILAAGGPGHAAYDWFRQAMDWYEKAEVIHPHGNQDPLLRWNACARILERNESLRPRAEEAPSESGEDEEVPLV